jgi:hypothetical protein
MVTLIYTPAYQLYEFSINYLGVTEMNKILFVISLAVVFLVTGCGIKHPQTAEEFRQGAPGAFMGTKESYEVNRPFQQVAASWKELAPQCLDVRVRTESSTTTSYQVIVTKYNPTVIQSADRAELHLQQLHEQGVVNVSEVPPKGYFMMVFDAIPTSGGATRIDYYGPSLEHFDHIKNAVKNWANGKTGCPDMTK